MGLRSRKPSWASFGSIERRKTKRPNLSKKTRNRAPFWAVTERTVSSIWSNSGESKTNSRVERLLTKLTSIQYSAFGRDSRYSRFLTASYSCIRWSTRLWSTRITRISRIGMKKRWKMRISGEWFRYFLASLRSMWGTLKRVSKWNALQSYRESSRRWGWETSYSRSHTYAQTSASLTSFLTKKRQNLSWKRPRLSL